MPSARHIPPARPDESELRCGLAETPQPGPLVQVEHEGLGLWGWYAMFDDLKGKMTLLMR